jgi:hypothetical protein
LKYYYYQFNNKNHETIEGAFAALCESKGLKDQEIYQCKTRRKDQNTLELIYKFGTILRINK